MSGSISTNNYRSVREKSEVGGGWVRDWMCVQAMVSEHLAEVLSARREFCNPHWEGWAPAELCLVMVTAHLGHRN